MKEEIMAKKRKTAAKKTAKKKTVKRKTASKSKKGCGSCGM